MGPGPVLAGDEGFHEAGVAEEVACTISKEHGMGCIVPTTCSRCQVCRVIHADDAVERVEGGDGLLWLCLRLDSILPLLLQGLLQRRLLLRQVKLFDLLRLGALLLGIRS